MLELYEQSIEKLTAAQIKGFESVEALKRQYRLEQYKDRSKGKIAELLNADSDNNEDEFDYDLTGPLKEQLIRRKANQQEVCLNLIVY